jgi:4-amino-4-deoxy-L-arabinose transferase-like glycosyltransferase
VREREVDGRIIWICVVAATFAAAALTLPALAHQSLWLDEIYTRDILGEHSLGGIWRHIRATESTPPLYYLAAKLSTDLAGTRSAAAMRAPSALAFIAAVPVSYLALRRLVGWRGALAAAAIVAVNPFLVSFALDARSYALLVLTGLFSVWGFAAVLERPSGWRYGAWALASVACIWTHYFGFFLVAGEAVILLAVLVGARRATLAWCVVIAAGVAPLIPLLAHQSGSTDSAFIARISLGSRLESAVRQFAMGANVPRAWLEVAGIAVLALGAGVGGFVAVRGRRETRVLVLLAGLAFGVPLALAAVGVEDRFYARNVLAALPLLAAVAGVGLLRARGAPLALYLVLSVATAVWVTTNWRYEQIDWRTALARTEALDPAAAVIGTDPGNAVVMRTYLGRQPVASVRAGAVWVAVEPARGAGQRALGPVPVPPAVLASVAGFRPVRELEVHGFRLVLERAGAPREIVAAGLPGAVLFPGQAR